MDEPWTFVCVCVCVHEHYLTMDYLLPLRTHMQVHGWNIFSHTCLHVCDLHHLLLIGGSLTIVDIHGWCASMVKV